MADLPIIQTGKKFRLVGEIFRFFKATCGPKKIAAGAALATPELPSLFHAGSDSRSPFCTSPPGQFTKYTAPDHC